MSDLARLAGPALEQQFAGVGIGSASSTVGSRRRVRVRAPHNGDRGPRLAIWSTREPVSVLGAWRSAVGQEVLRDLFHSLADTFSDCTSRVYEIVAADVVGDMAFTVGDERTQASINWKVARRHADTAPD